MRGGTQPSDDLRSGKSSGSSTSSSSSESEDTDYRRSAKKEKQKKSNGKTRHNEEHRRTKEAMKGKTHRDNSDGGWSWSPLRASSVPFAGRRQDSDQSDDADSENGTSSGAYESYWPNLRYDDDGDPEVWREDSHSADEKPMDDEQRDFHSGSSE